MAPQGNGKQAGGNLCGMLPDKIVFGTDPLPPDTQLDGLGVPAFIDFPRLDA